MQATIEATPTWHLEVEAGPRLGDQEGMRRMRVPSVLEAVQLLRELRAVVESYGGTVGQEEV